MTAKTHLALHKNSPERMQQTWRHGGQDSELNIPKNSSYKPEPQMLHLFLA